MDMNGYGPGTYSLEVQITDFNNCTVISAPVQVTVHGYPIYNGSNTNSPVCAGSSVQLSVNYFPVTSHTWTGPNSFTATGSSVTIPNFQASNVGIYTVVASNNGCDAAPYDLYTDTISNYPAVFTASGWTVNDSACENSGIYLVASSVGFTSTPAYIFTGPAQTLSGYMVGLTPDMTDSGVWVATASGPTCLGTATVTDTLLLTVLPSPDVTVANNGPLCAGTTLQLSGTVNNATSFYWDGPDNFYSTQLNPSLTNVQNINAGYYAIHAVDGWCTTNVSAELIVHPQPSVWPGGTTGVVHCAGETAGLHADVYGFDWNYSALWTGPNNFSSTTTGNTFSFTNADSGLYTITITGTTPCNGTVTVSDTLSFDVRPCVWPGDVNNDLIVDNFDILDLGLGYGTQGPYRIYSSYNWIGQYTDDWGVTQFCGQDMKYADCNGNGILTASDTFGISLNYNDTHLKEGWHTPQPKSASNPDLYFDMSGIVLTPGATVQIPIKLGTTSIPMASVYGIAAQVKISGISPFNGLTVTAPAGWMGSLADAMNFNKYITDNQTDWAYVRTDHNNASGQGIIAVLEFKVPAGTQYQQVQLYFDNVRIIGNTGNVITTVNILDDTATIYPVGLANNTSLLSDAVILPNPSEAQASLQLSLREAMKLAVDIYDISGRNVWTKTIQANKGIQRFELPDEVNGGLYYVEIKDESTTIFETLKWVKGK